MLIKEKVSQAVDILRDAGVDCWIVFVRETQIIGDPTLPFLVEGSLTWHSAFIISSSGRRCAIVGRYDKKGVEDLGVYDTVMGYVEGFRAPFLQYMRELNPSSIAVNFSKDSEISDGLTYGMYLTLRELLQEIGFADRMISAEPIVSALRERKTESELTYIRGAISIAQKIFDEASSFIKPGKTEREIAAFMKQRVSAMGVGYAWDPGSCPAVFTGPDTAEAHYGPTDRRVQGGHVLNMDFGVKYMDYCSDLQRTYYVLQENESVAPGEIQRGFDVIVNSIEQSRRSMKPGVQGIAVDNVARDTIRKAGYEEFPHALGHQVGRFAHDGTALLGPAWEKYAQRPFKPIEKGMVFTIEPRLTIAGRGIATVEEMVVVTENGAEYLSAPQKELICIRP